MNLLKATVAVMAAVALTACGAINDYQDADDMEKEHKRLVSDVNAQSDYLVKNFTINLSPIFQSLSTNEMAKNHKWAGYSKVQLTEIRGYLQSVLSKIGRIKEIQSHKNMKLKSSNGVIDTMNVRAAIFLNALTKYEKTGVDGTGTGLGIGLSQAEIDRIVRRFSESDKDKGKPAQPAEPSQTQPVPQAQ